MQKHLNEKSFILDYTIRRYREFSSDTILFDVTLYYKHINDTTGVYISETTQTLKRYSNNSQIVSDTLYKEQKQFSLFSDGREIYYLHGKGNDTIHKTEKMFTVNPFNSFPFWINRHLLDAGFPNRFRYDPEDDLWKDTSRHISVRFTDYTPVFASNVLMGTVSGHKNEFYFRAYTEITDQQFDSLYHAYEHFMYENTEQPKVAGNDTLPTVAPRGRRIFQYDSKMYDTLNVTDTCLVLLDFSYVRCFPCIMAIPAIDSISRKYAGVLKSYTLDPMDKYPKDSLLLNQFVKKYGLRESLYLCDISTIYPGAFNVTGFPTFFLINREGEIIYAQKGFSEDLYESLDKVIQENINRK